MDSHDTFPRRVWQIVASIPQGYVATYGDIARLAGSPRAARQVGGVLKRLPEGSTLPWHRVVNRHGDISLTGPDLQRQRQALLAEGVQVSRCPAAAISICSTIAGFTEDKKNAPRQGHRWVTARQGHRCWRPVRPSAVPAPESGRPGSLPHSPPSARYR